MIDVKLASDGDIDMTNNSESLVEDTPTNPIQTAQFLTTRLSIRRGEHFLAPDVGIPFFDRVMVIGANEADIFSIYRTYINQTEGIDRAEDIAIDRDTTTRDLSIEVKARSDEGIVITLEAPIP